MNTPPRVFAMHAAKALPALFLAGIMTLACTSCRAYRWGSVQHPQLKRLAVGAFANETDAPGVEAAMRQGLAESLVLDGSVQLVDLSRADAVIQGRIKSYSTRSVASVKARADRQSATDGRAYQTTIYGMEVTVEYELVIPGRGAEPVLAPTTILGNAEFSILPDLQVARRQALERAVGDAAGKVATAVVEAW